MNIKIVIYIRYDNDIVELLMISYTAKHSKQFKTPQKIFFQPAEMEMNTGRDVVSSHSL